MQFHSIDGDPTVRGTQSDLSIEIPDGDSTESSNEGSSHAPSFQLASVAQYRSQRSIRFTEGPEAVKSLMYRLAEVLHTEPDEFVPQGEQDSVTAANSHSRHMQSSDSKRGQPHAVGESSERRTKAELRQAAVSAIVNLPELLDDTNQTYPAGDRPAHNNSWQQNSVGQPRSYPTQHPPAAPTALAAAHPGFRMTTECTAVFQNDLFQGNQDLSSASATPMHDTAVATATDECAEQALSGPSQGYARKAAALSLIHI